MPPRSGEPKGERTTAVEYSLLRTHSLRVSSLGFVPALSPDSLVGKMSSSQPIQLSLTASASEFPPGAMRRPKAMAPSSPRIPTGTMPFPSMSAATFEATAARVFVLKRFPARRTRAVGAMSISRTARSERRISTDSCRVPRKM